ncbi:hypothetical protein [Tsukamurella soli]|uniref:Uncharacterized protein n=1 Tax=Tsukamurella soli TaxID=644556 RepID=A0ABP8JSD9_9ACTN
METNEPEGTLADIAAARRATRRVLNPTWVRYTVIVVVSGAFAMIDNEGRSGNTSGWIVDAVLVCLFVVLIVGLSRRGALRTSGYAHPTKAIVIGLIAPVLAGVVRHLVTPGTSLCVGLTFVVLVVGYLAIPGGYDWILDRLPRGRR